jgi:hypothetical protein
MCGVFGAQFTADATDVQRALALAVLGYANDERGDMSWGIFGSESPTAPWEIQKDKGSILYAPVVWWSKFTTAAGHTRWATTGAVNKANAHPYLIGNTIGLHNGTISNHDELNWKYSRKFQVDSMHLVAHVDEDRDLTEIASYGTLVFAKVDEPGRIYLGSWNGGDLAVYRTPIGILWSSVASAVKQAVSALDIQGTPVQLEERMLYVIHDCDIFEEESNFFTCEKRAIKAWDAHKKQGVTSPPLATGKVSNFLLDNAAEAEWRALFDEADARISDRELAEVAQALEEEDSGWEWQPETAPVLTREDRQVCMRLALSHGMSQNEARRVFDAEFDPFDKGDPLYWDETSGEFMRTLFVKCTRAVRDAGV